jgi:hypothetical protein
MDLVVVIDLVMVMDLVLVPAWLEPPCVFCVVFFCFCFVVI